MNKYITQMKITNFKNIENRAICFTNGLNFIVGNNGTGKTTIIEALLSGIIGSKDITIYTNEGKLDGISILNPKTLQELTSLMNGQIEINNCIVIIDNVQALLDKDDYQKFIKFLTQNKEKCQFIVTSTLKPKRSCFDNLIHLTKWTIKQDINESLNHFLDKCDYVFMLYYQALLESKLFKKVVSEMDVQIPFGENYNRLKIYFDEKSNNNVKYFVRKNQCFIDLGLTFKNIKLCDKYYAKLKAEFDKNGEFDIKKGFCNKTIVISESIDKIKTHKSKYDNRYIHSYSLDNSPKNQIKIKKEMTKDIIYFNDKYFGKIKEIINQ